MKTTALSVLLLAISLCTRAASDSTTPVAQPSIFWINGQWQTWNNGAWAPYGHKPSAKSDNSDRERRGNGVDSNQPARIRRTQRATLQLRLSGALNGVPVLRLSGQADTTFVVEASTDLTNWLPVRTNITTGGYFDFADNAAAGIAQRFYRGRWVP